MTRLAGCPVGKPSAVEGTVAAKQLGIFESDRNLGPSAGQSACGSFDDRASGSWLPVWIRLGLLLSPLFSSAVWADSTKGDISRVGDTTHLEFRGFSQWSYELKRVNPTKFTLRLPALDDATVAALNTWSDRLIGQVQVESGGADGTFLVTFTTADNAVESFDYLTDEPSRLIIDFYKPAPSESKVEVPAQQPAPDGAAAGAEKTETGPAKVLPKKKKVAAQLPAKTKGKTAAGKTAGPTDADGYSKRGTGQGRQPAGDERLAVGPQEAQPNPNDDVKGAAFDAADPDFNRLRIRDYEISDDAIIKSRKNFYLRFPVLRMPVTVFGELSANLPEFVIVPRDDGENKQARLLLDLYTRQVNKTERTRDRIGAFLKVYDHFVQNYPQSEYDEIVKNLAAHIYFLRFQQSKDPFDYERSLATYKYLMARYPESPLAERIHQWIVFSELERGNGLATIQEASEYLNRYPKSEIRDQARLALAEGNLILNKFDDARKFYQELAKDGAQARFRVEAVFREGDVDFAKQDWAQAEKTYGQALAKYPQHAGNFPNASYNLAESLFWQRKFKESLDTHIDFLNKFSAHPYGGYSMTRAGELLEAMGADRSRVIGAFLESYFRYRDNPGAEVARVRMLSQQMKSMNGKELKKAIEEMSAIARHSPLPVMNEFVKLMTADGYQRRGDNEAALKELITYFQGNPTSTNLDLFKARILRNIAEVMQTQAEAGKFMKVLDTQAKHARTWLKNSDRMDMPYFTARAYEQAGASGEAQKIYESVLAQRVKVANKPAEEKERKVIELLPSVESLRLRLAAVAVEARRYPEAYQQLSQLKNTAQLSAAENSERALLFSRLYRERDQLDLAKKNLVDFISQWKGEPAGLADNILELADLHLKLNEPQEAERQTEQILRMKKLGGKVSDDHVARALEFKARALQLQTKDLAAVETYQQLLDDYEAKRPLGSIRYKVGEILFERGDLAGAEKVWKRLDGERYAALKKLATERLANADWQNENRKYIKRIPAMSGFKGE
jgi:outer membrane protein assembly factor BamD (BamD/ComL family)